MIFFKTVVYNKLSEFNITNEHFFVCGQYVFKDKQLWNHAEE